jgi:putative alpha-1,2-mannosidase
VSQKLSDFAVRFAAAAAAAAAAMLCPHRSQAALKLFQDHIGYVTSRVNTVTGVAYKDDTTIMGYNLFNEPRWAMRVHDGML